VPAHTEQEILDLLRETGAILDGHFILSSGKHAARYIQCAKLLQHPDIAERVCRTLAKRVEGLGPIDVVIGPALGGIIVAYELAEQLGVRGLFTERWEGETVLRRGFEIANGERVLIAEDVVTTGRSTLEVVDVVKENSGEVIGIACIVDRLPESAKLPYPLISALKLKIAAYDPTGCPLCRTGIPAVKPGSRA
jgi:orotate phosphoribosyltransferase